MAKEQYLTLKELEQDKESTSVWVKNTTVPKGAINMSMPDGLGGTIILTVPVTWIPVDLTTQATKEHLVKSPSFRRMVTIGALSIVSEERAAEILREDDAKKEAARVYSQVQPVDISSVPEVERLKTEDEGVVSGFAMNIVGITDLDEDQVLNMIRGQEGTLTPADYNYISINSTMGRVKEYCAKQIV